MEFDAEAPITTLRNLSVFAQSTQVSNVLNLQGICIRESIKAERMEPNALAWPP